MNKIFSLALPALLALSLVARPTLAQPKTLTASEVLEAAAQKYAGFYEFEGNCSIIVNGESAIEGEPPRQMVSSANSKVSFVHGQTLNVSGDNNFGGKFEATVTPDAASIAMVGADGKKTTLLDKKGADAGASAEFLGGLTGVSGGGGAVLPALLLGADSLNPLRAKGVVEMQAAQNLGETACYVVTITNAERKSVTTLWIEQDKLLLRRMEFMMGPATTPAMTSAQFSPEMLAQNPALKDIKVPATTINYSYQILIFATQNAQ